MFTKSCPARIKAAGTEDGLEEGQFRAVVSVFGNKDSYGDVVMPGAFSETLADWSAKGDPIPVFWSHQMSDPEMCIGEVIEAKETEVGLEVLASIDLGEDASPKARQAYRLLKGRRVTQFSFAYDVVEGAWVEKESDSFYELRKLDLFEVGPTPIGANRATELLAVKTAAEHAERFAADVKAGRVLSTKNETTLREAVDSLDTARKQIEDVLAAVGGEEKAGPAGTGDDQEKASGKSEAPAPEASDAEPDGAGESSASAAESKSAPSAWVLAAHNHLTLTNGE